MGNVEDSEDYSTVYEKLGLQYRLQTTIEPRLFVFLVY